MEHWKRRFAMLGVGQAVSMLTSSILQMAIVWYLTQKTQSAIIVTLSTLCGFLPRAIVGMFSGAFIDKFDRKKVLILSDGGIALMALSLSLVSFMGELPIWFIYLVLALRSIGSAFHSPSLNAITPTIVPKEELARCAGIMQGFESVSLILSPALAAVLYSIWDLGFIVLLDVIGAAVAIIIVIFMKIPQSAHYQKTGALHIWQDTKEGVEAIRREPGLMTVLVISTLYAFVYFPIGSMYPLITMTYFRGSITDSSMVEIIFSSGTLIGSFVLGIVGNKISKIHGITASIGIYGIGALISGLLLPTALPYFMICAAIMGFTIPFFYGLRTTIFQSRIPDEYLGRALSLSFNVCLFAGPVGLILGGSFSEIIGVNRCFMICGILAIILALWMILSPAIRKNKDLY